MSDHPTTLNGNSATGGTTGRGVEWSSYATLHVKGEGQGVLAGFKSLRSGTLAELVGFVARLAGGQRADSTTERAGARVIEGPETVALAGRPHFPG